MSKTQQKEIQNFLREHPGYLKWSVKVLADKFKVRLDDIRKIKKELGFIGDANKAYNKIKKISDGVNEGINEGINEGVNVKMPTIKLPKILILDIETSPIRAYVWRLWKQDVYIDQIISDFFIISWAAKWLNEDIVYSAVVESNEILVEDDKRIMSGLWGMLNEADIVIAHNGQAFDIPKIKARFAIHGFKPTTFYQQIDTKNVASKEFGFSSNKLEALARNFGLGGKIHTEFSLWDRCMKGEKEALLEMERYNIHDVELLEQVYLKLRPYIKNHPNVTLYDDIYPAERCTSCGSLHLEPADYYYTQTNKFPVYRCSDCGSLTRGRKTIKRAVVTSNLSLGR